MLFSTFLKIWKLRLRTSLNINDKKVMELRFKSNFPFLFLFWHYGIKQENLGRKVQEKLSTTMAYIYINIVLHLYNTQLHKILFSATHYSVNFISESLTLNKLSERNGCVLWTSQLQVIL